ncbi:MAG TPA: NADH:ubiquinone reductase (Na(+)-transporting) subunit D [Gammaproteobacteria bacterium]
MAGRLIAASRNTLVAPLLDSNPITVQVLGLCSALAVTSSLRPAIFMSIALISVLAFSSVAVSLLRRVMPQSIRLIIEVTLIASAVIVVDEVLKAFAPDVATILSVFVGLIITNCIVLARVETFAMHHGVWASLLDAVGNGIGYAWILLTIGAVRELLGSGSLLGLELLPPVESDGWFQPIEFMLLTPSSFFLLALLVWIIRSRLTSQRPQESRAQPRGST